MGEAFGLVQFRRIPQPTVLSYSLRFDMEE
jgi:hypothetical protein